MVAAGDKKDVTAGEFRVPDIIAKDLARHIEQQIIFGDLPPRTRLVEEEIVHRHNVSRSPVREALRMLEQEGLAVRESRRGVRVSPLAVEDLDEVYQCRIVLEGLAAELAAQNYIDEDLGAMKLTFAQLETAHKGNDKREFFKHNLQLSRDLYTAAHNKTLKRLLETVGKQSLRYRYLAYSHAPEMMGASIEGNRDIIKAVEMRNARHARNLMEDLVQRSWTVVRKLFEENMTPADD